MKSPSQFPAIHSIILFLMLLSGALTASQAGFGTNNLRAALDIGSTVKGDFFTDDDALSIGPDAAGALFSATLQGLNSGLGLDALIIDTNLIIFSSDIGFTQGTNTFEDEDLVAFDPAAGTFAMYFDGSANGIPPRADLDAATLLPGTDVLLFSVDISITGLVAGSTVTDDDVVQFALATASLRFTGTTLGIDPSADINALHADGTNLYFSLDKTSSSGIIAGTGTDEDVWCMNTNTLAGVLITGFGFETGTDVTSLDEPIFSDADALSDFEEISGVDDPATTVAGTTSPIDPGGHMTDPLDPDSDSDGSDDGDEAIAGTDPNNAGSQLVITSISRLNGTNYITWASVTNRQYELRNTGNAQAYNNIVTGGISNPVSVSTTFAHTTGVSSQLLYTVTIDLP